MAVKQVLKLSCGHVVMRTRKSYYTQPSDKWWCPSCQCYKHIAKIMDEYGDGKNGG